MTLGTKINADNLFYTNTRDLANLNGEFDTSLQNLDTILLTITTAAQNEVALSYHRVRELHFLAVVFVATVYNIIKKEITDKVNQLRCNLCENKAQCLPSVDKSPSGNH